MVPKWANIIHISYTLVLFNNLSYKKKLIKYPILNLSNILSKSIKSASNRVGAYIFQHISEQVLILEVMLLIEGEKKYGNTLLNGSQTYQISYK